MGYIFPVAAADCAQAEQAEDISAGNVEAVEVEVSVLVVGERQEEAVEDAEEADEEAAEDVAEDADAEGALAEQGVRQPSLIPLLVLGLDGYGRRITGSAVYSGLRFKNMNRSINSDDYFQIGAKIGGQHRGPAFEITGQRIVA